MSKLPIPEMRFVAPAAGAAIATIRPMTITNSAAERFALRCLDGVVPRAVPVTSETDGAMRRVWVPAGLAMPLTSSVVRATWIRRPRMAESLAWPIEPQRGDPPPPTIGHERARRHPPNDVSSLAGVGGGPVTPYRPRMRNVAISAQARLIAAIGA